MQRAHGDGEFRDVFGVGDAQAVLAHVLDMLGPWIDEGDVFAGLHHMGAGISADRTCSDDRYLAAHSVLPAFPLPEASAPMGLFTSGEPWRSLHGRYALRSPISRNHRAGKAE